MAYDTAISIGDDRGDKNVLFFLKCVNRFKKTSIKAFIIKRISMYLNKKITLPFQ